MFRGRSRSRRANANQGLFQEFDNDDNTELAIQGGNVEKSLGTYEDLTLGGNAPVILNENDEMSLISNDVSRARFFVPPPNTPGSDAGSRGSKGSVKFVRAGESFTSRSQQPEDTVDL